MITITKEKMEAMHRLSTPDGIIAALAIDQRGALKKMLLSYASNEDEQQIIDFKRLVSKELTPYASAILLDPEYGGLATKVRDRDCGLLLAYEKTGYDASLPGRLPDILDMFSVLELKRREADAVKFLLYYDVDEKEEINERKHRFVERLGSECYGENIPFYLELISYDSTMNDTSTKQYAKIKPHKVIHMMKEFSNPKYKVDVLKVEIPVNMQYVEGFGDEVVYTKEEAAKYFKAQSDASGVPFIFLSAGVSTQLFMETLYFAKDSGSTFNGVLCGRATWKNGVKPFVTQGEAKAQEWLQKEGKENIMSLNEVLQKTATSWHKKVSVIQ